MIKVDRHTIIQVLGSLMNKPDYLSDTDKYRLEYSDFPYTLDKFIFSAISNLYHEGEGANKIKAIDIVNYLHNNPTADSVLKKENGEVFLQDCETQGEPQNFNYYYNKLKKINLIKEIQQSSGRDMSDIYCDDFLNPNYNKINEAFEKMSISDILNHLKLEVGNYEKKYAFNTDIEESCAVDGINELISDLKHAPEVGCQLQGEIFNTITRGGRKGKMYLRSAGSGVGKAIPNYTKIPTTVGWKRVDEIQVGDCLFDKNGKPTKVLGVYPQSEKKKIYKVYFKSGRVAECCNEHLWSCYNNNDNKNPNKLFTKTLQEILDDPKGLQNSEGTYRWSIPISEPVAFSTKDLSIDPYVMGLILGDGSFRYTPRQKTFTFSSEDEELVIAIKEKMGYSLYKKNSQFNYNWIFELASPTENHKNVFVEDILKDYPDLWQAENEDKFIPQEYLIGDISQRYNLLCGLLDTDGNIDNKGRVSYTTTSQQLRDNIITLCESLGMTCSYSIDKRQKHSVGECYDIHIYAKKQIKNQIFKLSRKVKIANEYIKNNKREERQDRDSIVNIEETNKYTDMTCFYVDNEEHLFLMNNFICTHNTRNMIGDACNIAYPIRFDTKENKWIETGSDEKVLYVMTEQDPAEIQTMILAYLTGYNEDMFLCGNYGEKELVRIKQAVSIMEKYKDNMLFARLPDPSSAVVKNLFRRYNIQYGVENFFYDYIFSSPAMLNEYRDLKVQEHVCLRLFTTTLKNLAIELDAFIMTST